LRRSRREDLAELESRFPALRTRDVGHRNWQHFDPPPHWRRRRAIPFLLHSKCHFSCRWSRTGLVLQFRIRPQGHGPWGPESAHSLPRIYTDRMWVGTSGFLHVEPPAHRNAGNSLQATSDIALGNLAECFRPLWRCFFPKQSDRRNCIGPIFWVSDSRGPHPFPHGSVPPI